MIAYITKNWPAIARVIPIWFSVKVSGLAGFKGVTPRDFPVSISVGRFFARLSSRHCICFEGSADGAPAGGFIYPRCTDPHTDLEWVEVTTDSDAAF